MPSMAYQIGRYQVNKEGTLTVMVEGDGIIEDLRERGFIPEGTEEEAETSEEETMEEDAENEPETEAPAEETTDLTISIPRDSLPGDKLENLKSLIEAKADLIKQSLGVEELPVDEDDEKITFPWFHGTIGADEAKAYTDFISKLTDMAKNQQRVTAKPGEVENPRYAFRCFLLRLGFIGSEYKTDRKILLQNLSGSSAFKAGTRKGEEE
ncbi:MAG: hypothetical protein IJK32_02830 [Bacteroidales bacterium]|nr:hypothetical protein [Bacteroidales bacterium]